MKNARLKHQQGKASTSAGRGTRRKGKGFDAQDRRSCELLREISRANGRKRKILATHYTSSSDRGRIAALKRAGFLVKEGSRFGHGTLRVMQAGERLMRR